MGTINIPQASHPTGTVSFGPIAVPSGLTGFSMSVARCTGVTPTIWPDAASLIQLSLDCSYDGGATYQVRQFAFENPGGVLKDRSGVDIPRWNVSARVDPLQPTHIKVSMTVVNGPILTSAVITTL